MAKHSIVVTAFLLLAGNNSLLAQRKTADPVLYVYDANWGPSAIENAVYLARMEKRNDTTYYWYNYNMYGTLLNTETYKDADGQIAHGRFVTYTAGGRMDSIMQFRDGLASGHWYYSNDSGNVFQEDIFEKGILLKRISRKLQDSLDAIRENLNDTLEKKDEKESYFRGGQQAWAAYIGRKLKYPERALNLNKQGIVSVQFIVDEQGRVSEPEIYQSVEYSLDQEALRIIRESPKWIPAVQNGKPVKSYKRQPIVFRLE